MEKSFSDSIIQTLSYFDIFDYPLTREELFRFLWQPEEKREYHEFVYVLENLMMDELKEKVAFQGGYYFLSGRNEIIAKRERKILYLEEKMEIVKRGTRKLRYLPFVRALFVCNQLPVGVKKSSDIDVFIVVKRGRMWLTRALITSVLSFFLLRRTNKSIADMICLSFYVTDDNLDLSQICISAPDIYQAYWTEQLIPVYDPHNFHTQIQEKNLWVKQYLPGAFQKYPLRTPWKVEDTKISKAIQKIAEWLFQGFFGFVIEKQIRFLQLQKMKLGEKMMRQGEEKNVVISDTMLKFHENDRKKYFKEEWEKRWKRSV